LSLFGITPDYDLHLMREGQCPTQVAAAVLARLEPILAKERPDWVLVQGDTMTAMAASLAAFYARVRVAHVEASLRTGDKSQFSLEEVNRRITSIVADLHFAPTARARQPPARGRPPGKGRADRQPRHRRAV
jgi:UDP-N-acetylglucosamine 2-epimerase (non-hydrolysing)